MKKIKTQSSLQNDGTHMPTKKKKKRHKRGELVQVHIKTDTMHFSRLKTK